MGAIFQIRYFWFKLRLFSLGEREMPSYDEHALNIANQVMNMLDKEDIYEDNRITDSIELMKAERERIRFEKELLEGSISRSKSIGLSSAGQISRDDHIIEEVPIPHQLADILPGRNPMMGMIQRGHPLSQKIQKGYLDNQIIESTQSNTYSYQRGNEIHRGPYIIGDDKSGQYAQQILPENQYKIPEHSQQRIELPEYYSDKLISRRPDEYQNEALNPVSLSFNREPQYKEQDDKSYHSGTSLDRLSQEEANRQYNQSSHLFKEQVNAHLDNQPLVRPDIDLRRSDVDRRPRLDIDMRQNQKSNLQLEQRSGHQSIMDERDAVPMIGKSINPHYGDNLSTSQSVHSSHTDVDGVPMAGYSHNDSIYKGNHQPTRPTLETVDSRRDLNNSNNADDPLEMHRRLRSRSSSRSPSNERHPSDRLQRRQKAEQRDQMGVPINQSNDQRDLREDQRIARNESRGSRNDQRDFRDPRVSRVDTRVSGDDIRAQDDSYRGHKDDLRGAMDVPRVPQNDPRGPSDDPRGLRDNHRDSRYDLRGSRDDLRGSRNDLRGSRDDLRGPRDSHRDPSFDPRGPRDDSRGPRDSQRDPSFDPRGPRDDSRGPRDDPRGPRDDSRGPRDDSRGPRDSPRDPSFDPRGPRNDSRGPRDDPRGPTDVLSGPNNDSISQRDDQRGTRDVLRGPKDDQRGHRDDQRGPRDMLRGPRDEPRDHRDDPRDPRNDQRGPREVLRGPRDDPRDHRDEPRDHRDDPRDPRGDPRDHRDDQRGQRDEPRGLRDGTRGKRDDQGGQMFYSRDDTRSHSNINYSADEQGQYIDPSSFITTLQYVEGQKYKGDDEPLTDFDRQCLAWNTSGQGKNSDLDQELESNDLLPPSQNAPISRAPSRIESRAGQRSSIERKPSTHSIDKYGLGRQMSPLPIGGGLRSPLPRGKSQRSPGPRQRSDSRDIVTQRRHDSRSPSRESRAGGRPSSLERNPRTHSVEGQRLPLSRGRGQMSPLSRNRGQGLPCSRQRSEIRDRSMQGSKYRQRRSISQDRERSMQGRSRSDSRDRPIYRRHRSNSREKSIQRRSRSNSRGRPIAHGRHKVRSSSRERNDNWKSKGRLAIFDNCVGKREHSDDSRERSFSRSPEQKRRKTDSCKGENHILTLNF